MSGIYGYRDDVKRNLADVDPEALEAMFRTSRRMLAISRRHRLDASPALFWGMIAMGELLAAKRGDAHVEQINTEIDREFAK